MPPRSSPAPAVLDVAPSLDDTLATQLRQELALLRPTRALVDLDAVAANFAYLRERAGSARVLCVVKADAYGHGAVAVARRLQQEGAEWLGVALLEEAEELRRWGVTCRILLLGGVEDAQVARVVELALTPAIVSQRSSEALARFAASRGIRVRCHLKVDTGMTRLGIPWQQFSSFADGLSPDGPLEIEGLFTHLASSDDPAVSLTRDQLERFRACRDRLAARGFPRPLLHVASSAGLLTRAERDVELVRPGVALYGLNPWGGVRDPMLTPALTLVSRIVRCADVPMGTSVGYGATFITTRPSRLATIPIGYEDGLPRQLSDDWEIAVHGRLAPLAGRVSMDLVVADVTDLRPAGAPRAGRSGSALDGGDGSGVARGDGAGVGDGDETGVADGDETGVADGDETGVADGDDVVIVGGGEASGAHSIEELARRLRTIPYEVTCGISGRVPRVHLEGGRVVGYSSRFRTLLADPPEPAFDACP